MSISVAKMRDVADQAFTAFGEATTDFAIVERNKTFDPASNEMTGSDNALVVEGAYGSSDEEYIDDSNITQLGTEIFLKWNLKGTTTEYRAEPGDKITDTLDRSYIVMKMEPTVVGGHLVTQRIVCK